MPRRQNIHKRRTYTLGEVKTAKAVKQGTNTTLYEVVYVEVIDPAMPTKGNIRPTINVGNARKLTVDSVAFESKDDKTNLGSGKVSLHYQDKDRLQYRLQAMEQI